MTNLKAIKNKIRSIEKTRKVTKAMEAVSASKMRKAQNLALSGRAYARAAVEILMRLSSTQALRSHPFLADREISNVLYIVITSDKGLAGSLNSGVLKAVVRDIELSGVSKESVRIVAIGRKANEFFSKRGFIVDSYHPNNDETQHEILSSTVNKILLSFSLKEVDMVKIAYQNFISTFEQRPAIYPVLPLKSSEIKRMVEDIVPARGKPARLASESVVGGLSELKEEISAPENYTIEPSAEEVLEALIPRLVSIYVYHALLETRASEHSARMVSMKNASDKALELSEEFTLDFNKARQAGITREVSEIIGGIEAMAV